MTLRTENSRRHALAAVVAAGALLVVACGGDAGSPVAQSVAEIGPVSGESGGTVGSSALTPLGAVDVASCEFADGPAGYDITLSGSSSASASGNETLRCRGTVSPAPLKNELYLGFPCYLPQIDDFTSNSSLALRTNGSASLKCQAK